MSDQPRSGQSGPDNGDERQRGSAWGSGAGSGRRSVTGILSACALLFSAVSLYETVLRQPEIAIHLAPVIHFTHEDGREALLVPVTISNRGARDGTITELTLAASAKGGAEQKTFYGAYTVSSGYFLRSRLEKSPIGGLHVVKDRPKVPFAPLTIAGRNSYSGTILFFPKGKDYPRLVTEPGTFTLTMTPSTPQSTLGQAWLDQLWAPRVRAETISVKLEQFNIRTVERGDTIELRNASW